jgi:hypothetical protein
VILFSILIFGLGLIKLGDVLLSKPDLICANALGPNVELQFSETIANGVDLNSTIKIDQQASESPLWFFIYNYANEKIIFQNDLFNIRGYKYENKPATWVSVDLPILSVSNRETFLPPQILSFDPIFNNQLLIPVEPFSHLNLDRLRLYISGKGIQTGTEYGATIDLCFGQYK